MSGRHGDGPRPLYHEVELAVCGPPGCGKTTLLESLLAGLARQGLRPGCAWHASAGSHTGPADLQARRAAHAGARTWQVQSLTGGGAWGGGGVSPAARLQQFAACDLVLAEHGLEAPGLDVLLFVDGLTAGPRDRVAGFVTADPARAGQPLPEELRRRLAPEAPAQTPVFHRDDTEGLLAWLLARWEARHRARPLLGLVLTGGHSERMGRDKAWLELGGVPLAERAARLLDDRCAEVWISARPGQGREALGRSVLSDRFLGFGPAGGILSALHERPEAAWLVLGCDLPFISPALLDALLAARNPWRPATAFRDPASGLAEPLCAVWEPRSCVDLLGSLAAGRPCPRRVLGWNGAHLLDLPEPDALMNANRPEDWAAARERWERKVRAGEGGGGAGQL